MSDFETIPTDKIWEFIHENYGDKKPELGFVRSLVTEYKSKQPNIIPLYVLRKLIHKDEAFIEGRLSEKQIIDFLCFEISVLKLFFRLFDGDDHYDIDLELIQEVLSGKEQTFGNKTYSANAIRENLFTQFSPTENFYRLLEAKDYE